MENGIKHDCESDKSMSVYISAAIKIKVEYITHEYEFESK